MTTRVSTSPFGRALDNAERHRVLRNTYALLALSMVPTVLGAWVGVTTGITAAMGSGLSMILFLGLAFGFMFAIEKTKNSSTGVFVLLGFTFFMGLMMSRLIAFVLGYSNGASLVMTAFGGTAGVFFAMATLASVVKRDLSGLQQFLFVGVIVLLVGMVINMFVASTVGMMVLSMVAIAIFSAFMLVDIKRVMDGGETNYISATLAIYLDLINVFQNLLMLLGLLGGQRD